jgi:hypothetical protein
VRLGSLPSCEVKANESEREVHRPQWAAEADHPNYVLQLDHLN